MRLAVVGVGHLGRHHARVARTLPRSRWSASTTITRVGPRRSRGREGLAVLAGPDDIAEKAEAVIVATPTSSHAALCRLFLERGLDVLVEKPITERVDEASELIALARARSRVLAVGHVERYNPAVEAVLARVRAPVFIEGHRLGIFAPRSLDVDVVLDLMIHDLQIVTDLVRRPVVEIRAVGMPVLTPRIDIANARIAFEGGCVANLTASRVSSERLRKLRVFAPSLYCSIDMHARTVSAFALSRDRGKPEIVPVEVAVDRTDSLARELLDFVAAVRERRDPLVSGEVGRDALALAHRVLAAIEEHARGAQGGDA